MNHEEKIAWMKEWAHKNKCVLELEGEVGFGRDCVGVIRNNKYPDYQWYDKDFKREDKNGNVWTPENAYHKHDCVAVLGRGEHAEAQLYEWLKWFDDNGFVVEESAKDIVGMDPIHIMFGGISNVRMVKVQP